MIFGRPQLFFVLVLFGVGVATPITLRGQVDTPEYLELIEKARQAVESEQLPQAVEAFEAADRLGGSRFEEIWQTLGGLHTRLEEHDDAARAYRQLFELSPGKSVERLRSLNEAYRRAAVPADALEASREFVNHAEDDALRVYGYNEIGYWLLRRDGDLPESLNHAAASFQEALALSGGRANTARRNLAEILERQGRPQESRNTLTALVSREEARPWRKLRQIKISDAVYKRSDKARRELESRAKLSGPLAGRGQALFVGGNVRKPEKISSPQPQYTAEARKARVQGVVIAQALIDQEGYVTELKILKGLPLGLSEAAEEVIRRWRFKPATLNGKPVAVYYNLTVNFRLQ